MCLVQSFGLMSILVKRQSYWKIPGHDSDLDVSKADLRTKFKWLDNCFDSVK